MDSPFKPKSLEEILAPQPHEAKKKVEWRGRPGERKPLWAILGDEPPIGWQLEQEAAASRIGSEAPMQLAQNDAALVPVEVPGFGRTYFDPEVAPKVRTFIDESQRNGIDVQLTSGFRNTARQTTLQTDPNATTPARPGNSLHEAGRAFDVNLEEASPYDMMRLPTIAAQSGFNWGGNFHTPDPGHFYIEVPEGIGNRAQRIQRAQEYYWNGLEP